MRKLFITAVAVMVCLALVFTVNAILPQENVNAENTADQPAEDPATEASDAEQADAEQPAEEPSEEPAGEPDELVKESTEMSNDDAKGKIMARGNASIYLEPDYAIVTLSVVENAPSATEATQKNNEKMEAIFGLLAELGMTENDFFTSNFNLWPSTDYNPQTGEETETFRVENQLEVKVRELDKIGEIISKLLDGGANSLYHIQYGLEDPSAAYEEALTKAVEKATISASILAKASGQELEDTPILITEGSNSNYNPNYFVGELEMAKGAGDGTGPVPIATQKVEVPANVEIVFLVR